MLQKTPPIRLPKYLAAARLAECVECGRTDTVCARHYNGPCQHEYGKGRGQKCHDICVANLCDRCDRELSEGVGGRKDPERDLRWHRAIVKTLIQHIANGGKI